jgi:tRNA(Ile)-lysidine synthase
MRDFERKLITQWRRLELPLLDETIVVATSGGADSCSLLASIDELTKLGKLTIRLVAAHFNHRLRGEESDEDEAFVRQLCSERKIELAVGHSSSSPTSNIEQVARVERYTFLRSTVDNLRASLVLTAHTVDDQAETFLLNLIRGSGIRGLSGMRSVRDLSEGLSNIKLVRPLLDWARRSDTEAYCHELGIKYRSDTMNENEAFTRVRIRKILIPLLKDFNPQIVQRLSDTARILRDEIGHDPEYSSEPLTIAGLKDLPEAELNRALRGWIAANRGHLRQIELQHIDSVRRLINSRKSGKTIELPGGDHVVKGDGKLVFNKNNVEKSTPGA